MCVSAGAVASSWHANATQGSMRSTRPHGEHSATTQLRGGSACCRRRCAKNHIWNMKNWSGRVIGSRSSSGDSSLPPSGSMTINTRLRVRRLGNARGGVDIVGDDATFVFEVGGFCKGKLRARCWLREGGGWWEGRRIHVRIACFEFCGGRIVESKSEFLFYFSQAPHERTSNFPFFRGLEKHLLSPDLNSRILSLDLCPTNLQPLFVFLKSPVVIRTCVRSHHPSSVVM
jgi:hypothetical protein